MARRQRHGGLRVEIRPHSPAAAPRVFVLSVHALHLTRLAGVFGIAVGVLVGGSYAVNSSRVAALGAQNRELVTSSSSLASQLESQTALLGELGLRTEFLSAGLANLDGRDRTTREIAGLDPGDPLAPPEAPGSRSSAGGGAYLAPPFGIEDTLPPSAVDAISEVLLSSVQAIEAALTELDARSYRTASALEQRVAVRRATPSGWPVRGPITSSFGMRANPFAPGETEFHAGWDIAAPQGTPIRATAPGRVVFVGWMEPALGNAVVIDHGYGFSTVYGHNARNLVSVGEYVERGQVVATVGSTGRSTGPHVEYQVRIKGVPVDPAPYVR